MVSTKKVSETDTTCCLRKDTKGYINYKHKISNKSRAHSLLTQQIVS